MKLIFAVGAGSFIGGVARYILTILLNNKIVSAFPVATLFVNITGCFLIGLVYGLSSKASISEDWRLFLATGILGGFTTFSAFSNETFNLLRTGHHMYAVIYILSSVILGLSATYFGYLICEA